MVLFILHTSPCILELGHGVKERIKFNAGLNLKLKKLVSKHHVIFITLLGLEIDFSK